MSTNKIMTYISNIGSGAYGSVYKATDINGSTVAVKMNKIDSDISGIGIMKELDMLARLKNHPFIIDLKSIYFIPPFVNKKLTPYKDNTMKNDISSFVLEYAEFTGNKFFNNKNLCNPSIAHLLVAELLLGIEYMHRRGIMHRDITPGNLLLKKDSTGRYVLKICDFGLGQNYCRGSEKTPGVTTSLYRAPEICAGLEYTNSCDIWSAGCIIMEIFGNSSFIRTKEDDNMQLFEDIIRKLPENPSDEKMRLYNNFNKLRKQESKNRDVSVKRLSFIKQIKMTDNYIRLCKENKIDLIDLSDLLTKMLNIDYKYRISATECLEHKFFDNIRYYIDAIKEKYSPNSQELHFIYIKNCIERQWMFQIVEKLSINTHAWFNYKLIFHAIDIFDRYLKWSFDNIGSPNVQFVAEETEDRGQLLSYQDVNLRFYVCLYMFHKYDGIMRPVYSWENFVPPDYAVEDAKDIFLKFERFLVEEVCDYIIFKPTLFEIGDDDDIRILPTDLICQNLIKGYSDPNIDWDGKGSVRALYKYLMKN